MTLEMELGASQTKYDCLIEDITDLRIILLNLHSFAYEQQLETYIYNSDCKYAPLSMSKCDTLARVY